VLVLTGIIAATGFAVLTRLPASGHYSPVLAAVMLVGFGTAGTAFGTMVIATTGVPGDEQGIVGGVINTSRQIGAALGAALLPAISAAVGHDAVATTARGTRAAMLAAAIAAAAAALIAWRGAKPTRVRPTVVTALEAGTGQLVPAAAGKSLAGPMQAGTARVSPVQASTVQASTVQASAVETSTLHASAVETRTLHASAVETRTVRARTVETSTLHASAVETTTVQDSRVPDRGASRRQLRAKHHSGSHRPRPTPVSLASKGW
jgi:hypothetical protein